MRNTKKKTTLRYFRFPKVKAEYTDENGKLWECKELQSKNKHYAEKLFCLRRTNWLISHKLPGQRRLWWPCSSPKCVYPNWREYELTEEEIFLMDL